MGSGITYNSRVSYRIFLLCEKKALRVCEQKYRRHICHVFFLLGDQSIFIARGRGGFRCFFFVLVGGGSRGFHMEWGGYQSSLTEYKWRTRERIECRLTVNGKGEGGGAGEREL